MKQVVEAVERGTKYRCLETATKSPAISIFAGWIPSLFDHNVREKDMAPKLADLLMGIYHNTCDSLWIAGIQVGWQKWELGGSGLVNTNLENGACRDRVARATVAAAMAASHAPS